LCPHGCMFTVHLCLLLACVACAACAACVCYFASFSCRSAMCGTVRKALTTEARPPASAATSAGAGRSRTNQGEGGLYRARQGRADGFWQDDEKPEVAAALGRARCRSAFWLLRWLWCWLLRWVLCACLVLASLVLWLIEAELAKPASGASGSKLRSSTAVPVPIFK